MSNPKGNNVNNNVNSKDKTASFFNGVKKEFRKIIWPSRDMITKQTIAVVSVSVALGLLISVLDYFFQFGLSFIAK